MANPVVLVVDDEPAVLRAIERELRGHLGSDYAVMAADSGAAALDTLRRLALRETPVALLLVDQRMPRMTGIELLADAIELAPDAKRVLLTAYADTDVAIRAINEIRLDQYLQKPWDPPEERLFPVLDDLLADWRATFRPPFAGIRLVGHRWSARAHEIKDYLSRNLVPYRWIDVETDPEAGRGSRRSAAATSSTPSSRRRARGPEPGSASTSRARSSSATGGVSTSSPAIPGGPASG